MKEQILQFWRQLTERDKLMLTIGSIVCIFYLFYLVIYSPLSGRVVRKTQQLVEDKATLAWMEQVKPFARPVQAAAKKISTAQMLSTISDSIKNTSFKGYAYQIQHTGGNEIQLSYEEVPYTLWINWFSQLSKKYIFSIKQLHVHSLKPGIVKLMLIIEV